MIRRISYVDPYSGGHHADFLLFFEREFARHGYVVDAYVPEKTWCQAGEISDGNHPRSLLHNADMSGSSLTDRVSFLRHLSSAGAGTENNQIFFCFIDPLVPALAVQACLGASLRNWSGIFFRDSFNHPADERHQAVPRLKSAVKRALLSWVIAQGATGIFTLNSRWTARMPVPVVWLPDALTALDREALSIRASCGWPIPCTQAGKKPRISLLFFGAIEDRKGLIEFCSGLLRLSPTEAAGLRLVVGGRYNDLAYRSRCLVAFEALRVHGIQVDVYEGYLSADRLRDHLIECDAVLAPYKSHIGSSGVLGLAAQYGRWVLGQARYQIGDEIRTHELGSSFDPTDADAVAMAVRFVLAGKALPTQGMYTFMGARNCVAASNVIGDALRSGILRPRAPSDQSAS